MTDMEIHDEYVPEDLFAEFTGRMPQVCVEAVIRMEGGVLLTRRTNEPAKGEWFWPGSRLRKGEHLEDATRRVAREELGIAVDIVERFGVYEHRWERSAEGPSRHTVNVVYRATPVAETPTITLDDQHSDHRILTEFDPDLHEYVRRYLEDGDLLE